MEKGRQRALIVLGAIGILELVALGVLFLYPSPKPQKPESIIGSHIGNTTMELTSTFTQNGFIPQKYTCDGEQISPPLSILNVPEGAQSLVLVVDDPDVPKEVKTDGVFDHWVLYNIPPTTMEIPEGEPVGDQGKNGSGQLGYIGPCPPKQYEPAEHRYVFTLYALDTGLSITDPTKDELLAAMQGHILAQAQLVGRYKRP